MNIEQVCTGLYHARKKGYRFMLVSVGSRVRSLHDPERYVEKHVLYHRTQQSSFLSPATVLMLAQGLDSRILPDEMAAELLKIDKETYQELRDAQCEDKWRDLEIRKLLLEVCGVREVLHSARRQFKRKI